MFSYLRAMLFVLVLTAMVGACTVSTSRNTAYDANGANSATSRAGVIARSNESVTRCAVRTPSVEPTPPIMAAPAAPSAAVMT